MRQHVCIAHPSIGNPGVHQQSCKGEWGANDTAERSMIPPSPHGLVLTKKVLLQRVIGTDNQDTINDGPPSASEVHKFVQHMKKTHFLRPLMTDYDAMLGVSENDPVHVEKMCQITKSVCLFLPPTIPRYTVIHCMYARLLT